MVLLPGHPMAQNELIFQLPDQKSLTALQEHSKWTGSSFKHDKLPKAQ